jgi:hypothetical protein
MEFANSGGAVTSICACGTLKPQQDLKSCIVVGSKAGKVSMLSLTVPQRSTATLEDIVVRSPKRYVVITFQGSVCSLVFYLVLKLPFLRMGAVTQPARASAVGTCSPPARFEENCTGLHSVLAM